MRETSVPMQCWCDVGRFSGGGGSAEKVPNSRCSMNNFSALSVRSFRTGLAIPRDRPTTAPILEAGLAAFSPFPSHPTLFLMLIVLTATPRTARACAGPSISRLEEVSRIILHGICARAPPAADVGTPPTRLALASRAAPLGALGRRSAMREPPEAGRGGCRVGGSILTQVPCRRQRPW